MSFTVRQHLPSGVSRVVLTTDDAGEARAVYAVHRTAARTGTFTELCDGAEILDADVSERAYSFKAAGRRPRQGRLF